jgi:hypothetical protein
MVVWRELLQNVLFLQWMCCKTCLLSGKIGFEKNGQAGTNPVKLVQVQMPGSWIFRTTLLSHFILYLFF